MRHTVPTISVMFPIWIALALLAACGQGDKTLAEVDPGAAPLFPSFQLVQNILDRSCVPCHKGEGEGEQEAGGDDTDLSTCAGIIASRDLTLQVIDDESMPPGALPRLTEREKLILHRWVENGYCAPCNPVCPDGGTP